MSRHRSSRAMVSPHLLASILLPLTFARFRQRTRVQRVRRPVTSTSLRQVARSCPPQPLCWMCASVCVCVCLNDMLRISPPCPPEGSFSGRYTIAVTGVLICKQGQDKCVCHSGPHGIPSSHVRGRGVTPAPSPVMTVSRLNSDVAHWKPSKVLAL